MDRSIDSPHRRAAIVRFIRFAGAATVLAGIGAAASAQQVKLAKAAVQYQDVGNSPGKDCDDCLHFDAGKDPKTMGTCKIVEGDIAPHGHCIAFTPLHR
jgi:hypothetical protein